MRPTTTPSQKDIAAQQKLAALQIELEKLLRELCELLAKSDYSQNDSRAVRLLRRMIAIMKTPRPDDKELARLETTTHYLADDELNSLCGVLGLEPFLTTAQNTDPRPLVLAATTDSSSVLEKSVGKIYFRHTPEPDHWDAGMTPEPSAIIVAKGDGHCGAHAVANVLHAYSKKDDLFLDSLQSRQDALNIRGRREFLLNLLSGVLQSLYSSQRAITHAHQTLLLIADTLIDANNHGDCYLQEHLEGKDGLRSVSPSRDKLQELGEKLCVRASLDGDLYELLLQKLTEFFPNLSHPSVTAMGTPGVGTFFASPVNTAATDQTPPLVPAHA